MIARYHCANLMLWGLLDGGLDLRSPFGLWAFCLVARAQSPAATIRAAGRTGRKAIPFSGAELRGEFGGREFCAATRPGQNIGARAADTAARCGCGAASAGATVLVGGGSCRRSNTSRRRARNFRFSVSGWATRRACRRHCACTRPVRRECKPVFRKCRPGPGRPAVPRSCAEVYGTDHRARRQNSPRRADPDRAGCRCVGFANTTILQACGQPVKDVVHSARCQKKMATGIGVSLELAAQGRMRTSRGAFFMP